jgi:alcohol dehydrogenase (cytochrome c)
VVKGKIVAGMTGCDRFKNDVCFISAHDPDTGNELWRTATIARPGEPGGNTWDDLPLTFRAGGDAWIPGSYDPKTNLIYWSTAQAKPWARISRGTDGDGLYTNCVLALDPDTGHVVWYRQLIQGESHDQDEVFESVLIDRKGQGSLFKMGKLGILWELDRQNGQFKAAYDLGFQNIVTLNPATGRITYRSEMLPKAGVPLDFCPGLAGLRNWRAMAYDPATQALYIPLTLTCQRSIFKEVEKVEGGGGNTVRPFAGEETLETYPHPASPQSRGRVIAMDINTGHVVWQHLSRRGLTSAILTTAGGLVVVADAQPSMKILDTANGKLLFEFPLMVPGSGFPIAFSVNGKQYLSIPSADTAPGVSVFALPEVPR